MRKSDDQLILVTIREILLANTIQLDALIRLLIEDGVLSEERFLAKLKQVQSEYHRREGNA